MTGGGAAQQANATPAARAASGQNLSISIVIPTKSRQQDLVETLQAMVAQDRRPEEIVIVDQSSSDCGQYLRDLFKAASGIHLNYIWAPEIRGLVAARNRGVAEASGSIIFFVDDDITMRSDCLANLLRRYQERPEVAGICGVDVGGANVPWWLVLARRAYMLGPFRDERSLVNKRHQRLSEPFPVRLISGGLMSYRRWVFEQFQFEGKLWGHRWNSSNDFSYRVSMRYPLIIDPKVCVLHRKPYGDYTPEEFVRVRVSGTFFFFSRNIKRDVVGWSAFIWILVAIFIRSVWRGIQARALGLTLRTFFSEVRQGMTFLQHPFEAPY